MSNVISSAERYSRAYSWNKGGVIRYGCIDDRPGLIEGPYRQTAGGPVGVGQDIVGAVMLDNRANKSAKMVEWAQRAGTALHPVQIIGGLAADILSTQENIQLWLHTGCAAEDKVDAITTIQATGDDELFDRARQILPSLKSPTFERITENNQRIIDTAGILHPSLAAVHLEEGIVWTAPDGRLSHLDPVNRMELINSDHVSSHFLADWRTGVAYDSRAAFTDPEAPLPAYHASFGDMEQEIARPLSQEFDFRVEDFMAASAVRHAATTIALDQVSPTGQIAIHRWEAMA